VREIESYVIEDFANKVFAAKKTNQKQVVLDIKEANALVENLTIILARALGNVEKPQSNAQEQQISVSMDGGAW
jgi:hypothetical protein